MIFIDLSPTSKISNVSDDFSIYTRLTETAMHHPNSDLRGYDNLEMWEFVGLYDLKVEIPKTVFYTPSFSQGTKS